MAKLFDYQKKISFKIDCYIHPEVKGEHKYRIDKVIILRLSDEGVTQEEVLTQQSKLFDDEEEAAKYAYLMGKKYIDQKF